MSDFTGRVAVVTGGTSGVGKAIAMGLSDGGASLAIAGRTPATLQEMVESIPARNAPARKYCVDLKDEDQIRDFARQVQNDFGRVDILIHSAGTITLGTTEAAPLEAFDSQYRVNIRAPYLLTQALLGTLKQTEGQIVFINSSAGVNGRAGAGQYAATKHALKAFADSLREEVNPHGVRVLSIFLGRTATPMQAAVYRAEGRTYRPELLLQPEDIASVVLSGLRLPRTAEVTDIHIRPAAKPDK